MTSSLPVAQIRAHIPFPAGGADSRPEASTRIEVVIDGEAVAQLHPLSVAYEMDWNRGLPVITARFISGDADIETKVPPFTRASNRTLDGEHAGSTRTETAGERSESPSTKASPS